MGKLVVVMGQRKAWHYTQGSDIEHMNYQAMEWAIGVEKCDRCERMMEGVGRSEEVKSEVERRIEEDQGG